jgi:hypothetical protein
VQQPQQQQQQQQQQQRLTALMTYGVINSQYVSSSQTNQQTTGYAVSVISAASAPSYKIVVPYANRRVYWAN